MRRFSRARHASLEIMLFEVGGVNYGIELSQIAGLVRDVPGADFLSPGQESACILFQGRDVPVFNGGDLLGGGIIRGVGSREALIFDDGRGLFGVSVDGTRGVVEVVPGDALYAFPPQQARLDSPWRPWGVLEAAGLDILLIDLQSTTVH